jgi:hypothetical protein
VNHPPFRHPFWLFNYLCAKRRPRIHPRVLPTCSFSASPLRLLLSCFPSSLFLLLSHASVAVFNGAVATALALRSCRRPLRHSAIGPRKTSTTLVARSCDCRHGLAQGPSVDTPRPRTRSAGRRGRNLSSPHTPGTYALRRRPHPPTRIPVRANYPTLSPPRRSPTPYSNDR